MLPLTRLSTSALSRSESEAVPDSSGVAWGGLMTAFLYVLHRLERGMLAALLMAMLAIYSLAIAVRELVPSWARYVAWNEEATRYMLVWLVFLALGLALAEGRQVAMTSYLVKLSPKLRKVLEKLIDMSGLVFSLYISWIGFDLTLTIAGTGQVSPTLGLSAAWLYLALPVGFLLLALRYALRLTGLIDRLPVVSASEGL